LTGASDVKVALVYLNNDPYVSRGAGYIASAMLEAGHEVAFFDTAYRSVENVAAAVVSDGCDVLMISASTLFYDQAKRLASLVEVPVVLGGVHATIVRGEILEDCPDIDFICVGEGEGFVVEFLNKWPGDATGVANLGYRTTEGEIVVNPARPCTDLNSLPRLRYDLFPDDAVVRGPFAGFCYVYATRGCPYRCPYCCNGCYLDLYGRDYLRTRDAGQVIEELLYLKSRYAIQMFYFGDEMILFDEPYVTDLFRRVRDEVRVPYGCMARVERITPSIVELFRGTGCKYVGMGIECGDEKFRREFLGRPMSNEQIRAAFASLRTIPGMRLTSFNMQGYPVPYDAELTRATKALNAQVSPDIVQTTTFYPFRGTKLYDYCVEHNLIDYGKVARVQNVFSESVLKPVSE
jgi:radical SAM superfamily enzyme YgiQ (UPF0313 family)